MKQYVCSICGYVYDEAKSGLWENLPADWKCPLCGAGKDAFKLKDALPAETKSDAPKAEKPHVERGLLPAELSIICSNLARGCEKQYMPEQAEAFSKLADFFRQKTAPAREPDLDKLIELIDNDLSSGFPYAKEVAAGDSDRGAMRALVWSEKVTLMLQSLLNRYTAEGDKMLENTGVYVCSICGFVYIGDEPPQLCPVCKVPNWKFDKIERRA